jgi:hypothetical protein
MTTPHQWLVESLGPVKKELKRLGIEAALPAIPGAWGPIVIPKGVLSLEVRCAIREWVDLHREAQLLEALEGTEDTELAEMARDLPRLWRLEREHWKCRPPAREGKTGRKPDQKRAEAVQFWLDLRELTVLTSSGPTPTDLLRHVASHFGLSAGALWQALDERQPRVERLGARPK